MSLPESTTTTSNTPNIGKNLFWDDVRIGLNVVTYGVCILAAGAVLGPWLLPYWFKVLVVLAGSVVTVLGLKICASIPTESKVSPPALGAMGLGVLCFLTVIANFFTSWANFGLVALSLVLGAGATILFTLVLNGAVKYLGATGLMKLTQPFVLVAAVFSLVFVGFYLTELPTNIALNGIMNVLTLVLAGVLAYLACSASQALARAQQGLPVEAPALAPTPRTFGETEPVGLMVPAQTEAKTHPVEPPPFTETEVEGFQTADSTAGKAIVILMTGVFSVGVVIYTIIAVVASMPGPG